MSVNQINGMGVFINLEDIQKVVFEGELIQVYLKTGDIINWNISVIGSFQFEIQEMFDSGNEFNMLLFPNPAQDNVNLIYNVPKETTVIFKLYDANGKLILEKDFGAKDKGMHHQSVDLTNINEGLYIVRLVGGLNTIEKKLIRN